MLAFSDIIQHSAQLNGTRIATVMDERQHTWTELVDRIARLATGLVDLGVNAETTVAILALNSDRYFEYKFAVPWAGGVFVPINTRLALPEIVYWLTDSESEVLFIDANFAGLLGALRKEVPTLREIVYLNDDDPPDGTIAYEDLIAQKSPMPPTERGGDDLAGLFYTGGTTGRSKGVMLSHHNLLYNVLQYVPMFPLGSDETYLHAAPMFHIADGVSSFTHATLGSRHVFIPRYEPELTMQTIQKFGITTTLLVPTMINMLVNHPKIGDYDLSSLVRVLYGASPMPEAVINRAIEVMPHTNFSQAYGQTETSPILTILESSYHTTDPPLPEKLKSAGRPVLGVELRIFDEDDHEVSRGNVGQICVKGENIMLGYRGMPEATAEALRGGWLHTGDSGYMDEDGFVFIVDRVKDMIISGGENVYSVEVENALFAHPVVAECAVVGIPDEKWGEKVHAIVRLKDGQSATDEELIEHCKELIASFKCPRSVSFREDPLPLSGAGKVLKRELRAPFWDGKARDVN